MRLAILSFVALSLLAQGTQSGGKTVTGGKTGTGPGELVWQTAATTFTGSVTKSGVAQHWDWGDGTTSDTDTPTKVYPSGTKTFRMSSSDGWGGLTAIEFGTKSMRGAIPALHELTALTGVTGEYNQFTGSIPDLTYNTALDTLNFQSNHLEGTVPSLATNTSLKYIALGYNAFSGFAGGIGSRSLEIVNFYNNSLSAAAINQLLADLVVAQADGNPHCHVDLEVGNAAPTGQGLTDKATLITAGWTVNTE